MKIETMKVKDLVLNPDNPRSIATDKLEKLKKSIKDFPEMLKLRPVVIDENNIVLGGNMRLTAHLELGLDDIPVIRAGDLTEEQKLEFIIKDNVSGGEWDWDVLQDDWDTDQLDAWGLDVPEWDSAEEVEGQEEDRASLSERFLVPPFSILDTKQGYWQDRKRQWLSIGIKSELGRDVAVGGSKMLAKYEDGERVVGLVNDNDTSVFDPVLCEIIYKWFNVDNGIILDPFAGGSVRGIVASTLGYKYIGNDLREEQIKANIINAKEVIKGGAELPVWTCGDSRYIDEICNEVNADLLFSCPPYADLEVYSDMENDISNMPYSDFMKIYKEIIIKSCKLLKDDRFACFVVGDVRDKKGYYRNFISDTISCFLEAGLVYYNEIILVNCVGSLALRAGGYMKHRKVGKQHQNVLVFFKGDSKTIKENYKEIEVDDLEERVNDV